MVQIQVYKKQFRITIPKELAEAKSWNKETKLRFVETIEGTVIIKEIK